MRTLGRTSRGHELYVLGPTAEVSQHETYRREWIGRDGNAGARLGAALGQQRLAMRAVLLAAPTRPLLKVITPNAATIFALVLRLRLRSASVQTIGRVRSVVPNHVGDL
jgi:hypothetical protein